MSSETKSETFDILNVKGIPYIDVSASKDEKKLYIHIVNRSIDKDIKTAINLNGFKVKQEAKIFFIHSKSVEDKNSFEKPDLVKIKLTNINNVSQNFSYTFQKHSITVMEITLN